MGLENKQESIYRKAHKKVKRIKSFYNHLFIYILMNIPLVVFRISMFSIDFDLEILKHPEFFDWIYWNTILWGIGVVIHGLSVFKFKISFVKNWEERQIQKYMNELD